MFKKIVAIEPVSLIPSAQQKLYDYAKQVVLFDNIPQDDAEIIRRIGDADAVLLSYTSRIEKNVLDACPNIRYIGMCCSLYSEASANVDIRTARAKDITVYGIRDYGDQGVVEYVVCELVRYLHGFGGKQWQELPVELTDLKVGIVGLGTSGQMIAAALQALGADLYYFSRTRKPEQEAKNIKYLPLKELLPTVDVVCTCLNKNVILFHDEQFEWFGHHKIMFNTSIGPSHDVAALAKWLAHGDNEFFCDTAAALGDNTGKLLASPHVNCMNISSGRTQQAFDRLSEKVLKNIETFLGG
ncbi:D-isomer specific 2-hydroxyacid dehydrogenase family protein [Acetonema longum]|uniref:D-isomer specific 2-hydroxyacid dehydrogenase NAD-binding protein n=1 Tax=Acetonema longum DSM 6540 TaxID=1009370 RepID=F7NJC6_9FIRM|nr:D-isomer specific 2-hydroxyacid dehydrogenase family protein [Acetonema longum]EGO63874.1 D-isomer specific 2-hydroxyacid dehydrogenase NAD-binding protein [Acetonema longum DSM 6540]